MPERKVDKDYFNAKYFLKQLEALTPKKAEKEYSSSYGDGVLVGNWTEKSRSYVRKIQPLESTYDQEYKSSNVSADYNDYYDYKIRGMGTDWHTVNDQGLPEQYYNNFSTLYDLTYNRACKKVIKRPLMKYSSMFNSMRPQPDMTENFGNTNQYGLQDYMKSKWEEDKKYEMHEIKTRNQETYVEKETPRYCGRKSPYKAISSSFCKVMTMHQDFNTRNKKLCVCADFPPEFPCPKRNPNMILPSL